MILFLYGLDTYRSRGEMKRIIEDYKKANPNWLNFIRIDAGDNASGPEGLKARREIEIFEQIRQTAETVSMFNEKKLIVIEEIFQQSKYFQEELLNYLKEKKLDSDKNNIIIFWAEKIDSGELFQFLEKKANVQEFKLFKGNQLKSWIKDYVSKQKGKIENSAVEKLVEYVGSDLWRMSNEINKLLNYNKTIKIEDIELLIKPEIDLNIFNIVDALGYKNKNKVLKLFKQYLEKGEDEAYLLSMFIYQIRNLIKVKSGGKLDMHAFVIQKTRQQVKNFSWNDLKKIYSQLLTIDFDVKTGRTDIRSALEVFLVNL